MRTVRAWLLRIGGLFQNERRERELADEIESNLQLNIEDHICAGMTATEARRHALLKLGGIESAKENYRDYRGVPFIESLWRDVRYGIRTLRKSRGFTLIAVLTLALGIGSVTLIFSAIYGVILNTFPFRDAGQVTSFTIKDLSRPNNRREFLSVPEFLYFREHSQAFDDFSGEYGGFGSSPVRYTNGNATYQFDADFLSVNSFRLFGVEPLVGRLPAPADVKARATPVFVMGSKLWRAQFNGDPTIVGKSFTLNGVPTTLVGIMPPRFRWAWVDVWLPFSADPAEALTNPELKNQFLYTVGRLKPGVSLAAAAADLDTVAHQYARIAPADYPKQFTVIATSLADRVTGGFKELMYPLLAAVFLLLLMACSNIANLLLSRATVREREIAIRASLGASRTRLVRQLLIESLLLATAGCLMGCLLAWVGIRALVPLIPYNAFPQEAVITLNIPVLAAALIIAIFSTILCGMVPALQSVHADIRPRLAGEARGSGYQFRQGKLRSALVIAEVSVAIVLLIGAGLMMRTFWNIKKVDLGFDPHYVLAARLSFPQTGGEQQTQRENILSRQVLERVESLPAVAAAALVSSPPPFDRLSSGIIIPGKTHAERWNALIGLCSEQYFDLLRLHLLYGRVFSRGDIDLALPVTVISGAFARKYFGTVSPIGQKVQFAILDEVPKFKGRLFAIIGVVADIKNGNPRNPPVPEAYIPYTVAGANETVLLVRSLIAPGSLIPTIRRQVWQVDRDLAVVNPATIEAMLQRDMFSSPQFEFVILTTFAAIALALLMAGIFSLMAYTVWLQTHEIGIRMALGARPGEILAMVVVSGARLAAVGIVTGVGISMASTRFLQHFLFGIQPKDSMTFLSVSAFVILLTLLACWIPARRAMRVDPLVALRHE